MLDNPPKNWDNWIPHGAKLNENTIFIVYGTESILALGSFFARSNIGFFPWLVGVSAATNNQKYSRLQSKDATWISHSEVFGLKLVWSSKEKDFAINPSPQM